MCMMCLRQPPLRDHTTAVQPLDEFDVAITGEGAAQRCLALFSPFDIFDNGEDSSFVGEDSSMSRWEDLEIIFL